MKKLLPKVLIGCLTMIIFFPLSIHAQPNDTTLQKLITLQASFINQIKNFGFNPSLPAPKIVMDNPVSFGNYDDTTNILHTTSSWQTLPQELKVFFNQAVGGADSSDVGKDFFDKATHQWIFVHELGHWWRACQKQKVSHYDEEMGANRIAVAYWREADSSFMNWQINIFEDFVSHFPNPVPKGISKEKYLNENYETIGSSPVYTWYQAEMIIDAYNEQPKLTFKNATKYSGNLSH